MPTENPCPALPLQKLPLIKEISLSNIARAVYRTRINCHETSHCATDFGYMSPTLTPLQIARTISERSQHSRRDNAGKPAGQDLTSSHFSPYRDAVDRAADRVRRTRSSGPTVNPAATDLATLPMRPTAHLHPTLASATCNRSGPLFGGIACSKHPTQCPTGGRPEKTLKCEASSTVQL